MDGKKSTKDREMSAAEIRFALEETENAFNHLERSQTELKEYLEVEEDEEELLKSRENKPGSVEGIDASATVLVFWLCLRFSSAARIAHSGRHKTSRARLRHDAISNINVFSIPALPLLLELVLLI